ncbi:hypothetical protein EJD97_005805, partial [Solanum chilense]
YESRHIYGREEIITRRMSARGLEEGRVNKEIPPKVEQVHQKPQEILLALSMSITTHVNRGVEPIVNAMESIMTSSLRDFVRINYPIFHGSKKGQDLQDFLDEWEELKEAFLGKYFPHERREVKVEEFINLKKGSMSVEEHSLKFTIFSSHASSKNSKISRISKDLKRSGSIEKNQPRFKKALIQDEPTDPNVNLEKGSGSQGGKPTYTTCGKKYYVKCLVGNCNFFGCGKDGHKVMNCPTISARRKQDMHIPPSVLDGDVTMRNRFYAMRVKETDRMMMMMLVSNSFYL